MKKDIAAGSSPVVSRRRRPPKQPRLLRVVLPVPRFRIGLRTAALTALRPTSPPAKPRAAAPIRVKQKSNTSPAPARDAPVESPKSVLKALSNASSAMEAFKKPEKKNK